MGHAADEHEEIVIVVAQRILWETSEGGGKPEPLTHC